MSRPHLDPSDDARWIAEDLTRIADTLDDFMDMSLAAQSILVAVKGMDPDLATLYQPFLEELDAIRKRRAAR